MIARSFTLRLPACQKRTYLDTEANAKKEVQAWHSLIKRVQGTDMQSGMQPGAWFQLEEISVKHDGDQRYSVLSLFSKGGTYEKTL